MGKCLWSKSIQGNYITNHYQIPPLTALWHWYFLKIGYCQYWWVVKSSSTCKTPIRNNSSGGFKTCQCGNISQWTTWMKKSYAATFLDDPYHMNEEIYSLIMCRNLFVKLNQSTNWRENYRNKYLPSLAQPSECRETLLIELEGHWHTANQSPWCFTLPLWCY